MAQHDSLCRGFGSITRADGDRAVDSIASTEAEDGHGTIIDQLSWDLSRFLKNPVVLYSHNLEAGGIFGGGTPGDSIPIARAENVRVEGKQLRARIVFPPIGADALSDRVWTAIETKRLNGISVGFRAGKVTREEHNGRECHRLSACSLVEISIVPIPSNAEALIQRSIAGHLRSLRAESRSFDERLSAWRVRVLAETGVACTPSEAMDTVLRNLDLPQPAPVVLAPLFDLAGEQRARDEFADRVVALRARDESLLESEAIDRVMRGLDMDGAA